MIQRLTRQIPRVLGIAAATWLVLALVLYLLMPRTLDKIYQGQVRNIVQYDCGRPLTDVLVYTLKPGECRFTNPEFDTRIVVDAEGFRNTPAHTGTGPLKVAVAGDSHAMGWGVEQHEKLASLLARDPRFTVRDLSMSSYGTPRELIAVLRHTRDANAIVLQYCDNDRAENAAFLANPDAFFSGAAARAESYWTNVRLQMESMANAPIRRQLLQQTFMALATTYDVLQLPPRHTTSTLPRILEEEARLFASVLAHFHSDLADKTIIVFESHPRRPRPTFAATFRKALADAGLAHVIVLDLAGTLDPRDYFHLDDHMRASGHAKIAARIITELDRPGRLPQP